MPLEVKGEVVTTGAQLFKEQHRQSYHQQSQRQTARRLYERGRIMFNGVRSAIAQRHTKSGKLLERLRWHAPYRSISESAFTRKDELYASIGVYDKPGEHPRQKNTTARAFVGVMLEYGSNERVTRTSVSGFATPYRGRIKGLRVLSRAAGLSSEERKLTAALRAEHLKLGRQRAQRRYRESRRF